MKTRNHLGSCQEHSSNPKGMPALCYFTALELSSLYLNRTMLPILGSCPSNVLQWHTGLHHSSATVQLPGQPPTPSMSFERSAALCLLVMDVSPAPTVRPEACDALSLHACLVAPVVSDSLRLCGPQPSRLLRPWDSPGRNTNPEILTGGWNVDLLHCRQILYHLSYQGSPGTQPLYTKFTKWIFR